MLCMAAIMLIGRAGMIARHPNVYPNESDNSYSANEVSTW